MENIPGDQPKVPLTEEQISSLEEMGAKNVREMDPNVARELLRAIPSRPEAPHEDKKESPQEEPLEPEPVIEEVEPPVEPKGKPGRSSFFSALTAGMKKGTPKESGAQEPAGGSEIPDIEIPTFISTDRKVEDTDPVQEVEGQKMQKIEMNLAPGKSRLDQAEGEKKTEAGRDSAIRGPYTQVPGANIMWGEAARKSQGEPEGQKQEAEIQQEIEKLPEEKQGDGSIEDREKYSRTFELRNQVKEMQEARVNLLKLEKEASSKLFGGEKKKEAQEKYEAAKQVYEQKRAEYVGEKAWRVLKDKQKLAEIDAEKHQSGKFESFRKGWRWLGEQNLEKAGWKPTGRVGKFFARTVSARTAISLGLLGGGVVLGAGSAVGIGAIAVRRALAGAGAGFGAYDLIRTADERKAINNIGDISKLSAKQLEDTLADIEARAKFSGQNIVRTEEYQNLRREYSKRIESQLDREKAIKEVLLSTDAQIIIEKKTASRRETRIKAEGLAVGAIIGSGALAELVKNGLFPEGITEEEVKEVMSGGPILPADTAQALGEEAGDTVLAPTGTTEVAGPANVLSESQLKEIEAGASGDMAQSIKHEGDIGHEYLESLSEHTGTVKEGGSASQAVWDLVNKGVITKSQLVEAWTNPASVVGLADGRKVPISELGLTHAGDKINYIAATADAPARFEFIDNAADNLKHGSNEDLAKAFDKAGQERPGWLEKVVGKAEGVASAVAEEAPVGTPATEMISSSIDASGKPIFGHIDFADQMPLPADQMSVPVEESKPVIGPDLVEELKQHPPTQSAETMATAHQPGVLGIEADVKRGFFGGIKEITLVEAPGHAVRLPEINALYVDPKLSNITVPEGMSMDEAKTQIYSDSRRLVLMRRFVDLMGKEGVGVSDDRVRFIRRMMSETINKDTKTFGPIYRPDLLSK